MKIGAVCQLTGLSDRTVRFYTEEGLLSPSYTKNYLGRKTFDFSESDVEMLKHIAVLRKYGFSIPEIKAILEEPAKSVEIIDSLREKKQQTIQTEQELLDVLLTLDAGKQYTVPELAEVLNNPKVERRELPDEPSEGCLMVLCKIQFWWICAPLSLMVMIALPFVLWDWESTFLYKKYYPDLETYALCAVGWFIPVLCAAAMIFLEAKRGRMNPDVRHILIILLTMFHTVFGLAGIMIASIGAGRPPFYSKTEDTSNYMVTGIFEKEKMGSALDLLFPDQIPEYALGGYEQPNPDTTRYYNYVGKQWDSEFELYAQWELTESDLYDEKKRIREELGDLITSEGKLGEWEYWSIRMNPVLWYETPKDHVWESIERSCLFFAFDDETGMVRYIASYSDNYASTPGFCALDWD